MLVAQPEAAQRGEPEEPFSSQRASSERTSWEPLSLAQLSSPPLRGRFS